ncbi:DUF2680 domain-containing protein [Acetonema longum]|nr:DUF2680 domain-containing protein [Acetonema longum]
MAAPGPGGFRGPCGDNPTAQRVNLTDSQKADLAKIAYKMLDLKKQQFQVYVKAGAMTQEVADARMTLMKDRLDKAVKDGTIDRMGMGMGRGYHHSKPGPQPATPNK